MLVCGLSGLPWVGGSGGLMLEVNIEPGGRPRWLVLPHAHGPNVNVKVSFQETNISLIATLLGRSKCQTNTVRYSVTDMKECSIRRSGKYE